MLTSFFTLRPFSYRVPSRKIAGTTPARAARSYHFAASSKFGATPLPSAKRTPTPYAAVGSPFMAAARSTGPPIASGSLSVGGTCTMPSLRPDDAGAMSEIVPVVSLLDAGEAAGACGITTAAVPSITFTPELLNDCRPIGVGEVIEGGA